MDTTNLINPCRFDLIAKYLYIKFVYFYNIHYYKDLYLSHIKTFNKFWEYPGTKNGESEFINSFNKLIDNLIENGFNSNYPIEKGSNNIIINGSHRLMCCKYFNIEPQITTLKSEGCNSYHYDFFINRNNYWRRNGELYCNLSSDYCDTMTLEYIKLKPFVRTMTIYSKFYCDAVKNELYIRQIIEKYGGTIYYKKSISLSKQGHENLIKEMYRGEKWIGGLFPNGTGGKMDVTHSNLYDNEKIILYVIDFHSYVHNLNNTININNLFDKHIINFKTECRKLFNAGKHSLHIPDTQLETFRIASSLLNKNSIKLLQSNMIKYFTDNNKILLKGYFEYIDDLSKRNDDLFLKDNYCIIENFFSKELNNNIVSIIDKLDDEQISTYTKHNNKLKFIKIDKSCLHNKFEKLQTIVELIHTPNNILYFNGFKFIV